MAVDSFPDLALIQRRTLWVLAGAQVLGGLGVGAAVSVGGLIAEDVSGSTSLSGLAQTSTVLGAALGALPMARVMTARGRRPGLVGGYLAALLGAVLVIAGTVVELFLVVLVGAFLQGAATATNLQSRYAAADLAEPQSRGRALATVVWATTVGVVLGPNLTQPGATVAGWLGLPPLTGPIAFSVVAYLLAVALLQIGLRPDPLLAARTARGETSDTPRPSMRESFAAVRASRVAMVALVAVATAQTVMVAVMVMTPVHMQHHDASLEIVGFVISAHVAGMFALSPVVGWLTDRLGPWTVLVLGQLVLGASLLVAGLASSHAALGVGLALLGLGWSFGLIAGSTLLSSSVPEEMRPGAQGASDFVMGMCGAAGGAGAGVVVGVFGFGTLTVLAGVALVPAMVLLVHRRVGRRIEHTFG